MGQSRVSGLRGWGICFGLGAALVLLCATGCPVDDSDDPAPSDGSVSFARDVEPLLVERCADCHQPGGFAALSGIALDLRAGSAYDALVGQASEQVPGRALVAPGDADASYLFEKISSDVPAVGARMPLFDPRLSDAELEIVLAWIEGGAARD